MQNLEQFIASWTGQYNNYDGGFGPQCVDLVNQYVVDVLGERSWKGNAIDKWNSYPTDKYERLINTPSFIPQRGDIVVWKNVSNGLGHIAIYYFGNVNNFQSFDQNWPEGSRCHMQNHNYTNVLGVLRHRSGFSIEVTTSSLNIRSESNTRKASIGRLSNGQRLSVLEIVTGESVNGNTTWYRIGENMYISAYWTKRV